MFDLKEATEIAKKHNSKYNAVQEYADAYEFFIDDGVVRMGGGDCSIIIDKNTGSVLRWAEYFMDSNRNVSAMGEIKPI